MFRLFDSDSGNSINGWSNRSVILELDQKLKANQLFIELWNKDSLKQFNDSFQTLRISFLLNIYQTF